MQELNDTSIKMNMAKIRVSLGLSQTEMAKRLGISLTAYRKLENGKTRIFNEHVMKFADSTNMSVSKLVNGFEPINSLEAGLDDVKANYDKRLHSIEEGYLKEIELLRTENKILKERLKDKEELLETERKLISHYENLLKK